MTASVHSAGQRATATDSAHQHLKHLILTGELAPGEELREVALSESTGFGRSPVREALRRLVQEGFVEVRPRQGYRVATVTLASVRDLFEMRLLLEPTAVELAARRAPREELEALHALAHRTYVPGDTASYEAFLQDNREFHVRIARASGNERLARTLQVLLEEMQRLFFIGLGDRDSASEMMHEHHDLHDALLARDGDRARAIVIAQIETTRGRVLEGLITRSDHPHRTAVGVVLTDTRPRHA
ncbi:GntR family transcriptional regulator [Streptomyces radicis]|uniref:GntR family transcriptional regulator n=1 Tax=Streptomyces radicis TaxID=1750517 RepID=A0A3A9WJ94_9ACTN|nr:GntR family transcriptional regulator [Streptomyces radicis]RKN12839.1 GntR family transcriptional regulator [Streptomyces radicis]RKN27396.1 GntR family transcriptional regulator [Streptomyces radicis]